ncbi:hypothetical protein B0H19DRAFT_1124878 [Mycena capillaripes]|nr:hypothetical protein B0H19DRAFT_1124878 [Mycena capillaripes]
MSPVADTPAITAAPTLIQFPSFSEIPTSTPGATLAPIPATAATDLAALVEHASSITAEEMAVATALCFPPSSSFIDDEEGNDLIDDFLGPAKDKGKAKTPLPPSPAPASPASAPPSASNVAGPSGSSTGHTWLKKIHFSLTQKPPQRYGAPEHKANRLALDTLAVGTAGIHDRVEKLTADVAEGFAGFEAQLLGFQADAAEMLSRGPAPAAAAAADSYAIPSLVEGVNKLGSNGVAMGNAINDSRARTLKLENEVTTLQASLDSHDHTIKLLLARSSAGVGIAPSAAFDDARLRAIIQEIVGTKRGREEDDLEHPAKRHAPAVVLFGPMDWDKKWHLAPRNLILSVIATMRSARITSRKGPDEETAVLVFEAESVATWFIEAWNTNSRVGYECCIARPNV